MAKVIMVQGTMSNVGKSIITAGLCRIFTQDGYKVAPFKSQNMSLNSFVTENGLEMGRAQVMQAEACNTKPSVFMNPILLKPNSDTGSQVIVNGEVLKNMKATEYFEYKQQLIPEIISAFNNLAKENDIIVIEGAGSPAEINLKSNDIVNMGLAKMLNSPVLLVGDIDRGGVFATLFGTVKLLETYEQKLIKGLIINKFRGDLTILQDGLDTLEEITEKKVLGVVPMLNLDIDDEDSLSDRFENTKNGLIDIVIIHLPHISNFTDFNALERFENVSVRYVKTAKDIKKPDLIIIPGTKNTIFDLLWLKENNLDEIIINLKDTPKIGICGGFQILGNTLEENSLEYNGKYTGLGLLDCNTIFKKEKVRTQISGKVEKITGFFEKLSDSTFEGYEIHMGDTKVFSNQFSLLSNFKNDGAVNQNILGTYVHGIFDSGTFCEKLIEILLEKRGINIENVNRISILDYKNQQYDKLADALRENIDMKMIYEILEEGI